MDLMHTARCILVGILNSPAKRVATIVGVDDKRVDEMYVDLGNKINEERFNQTLPKDRIVLLPQCLRGPKCKAVQDDDGYRCKNCGGCTIPSIINTAHKVGSKVFILPGASMSSRIIKKYRPGAVLGVACQKELVMGMAMLDKANIPVQAIFLSKDGCRNTEVDLITLKERIKK